MDSLRPLTAQEEIYWQLTFNDQIHPVIAAHVTGSTRPEQWRIALDALQTRHPLLSVSIESPSPNTPGLTQPFFRRRGEGPIPLRIVPWTSVLRWEEEIERELAIPFRPGETPLARAALIHTSDRSIFILAVSHSISDGTSLSLMVRDILSAVVGQPLESLAFPRSAEQMLGIEPAIPASPATDALQDSKVSDGPPTVRSLRFTEALTDRLITVSRQNGTTLHGALAAAFVLAMRQQIPGFQHEVIRIISPVNIRSVLGAGDECGMYFTSPKAEFDPAQSSGFWDMARSVRQGIIDASTRDALLAVTAAMQGMTANGLTKAAAADTLNHVFATSMLLTNLGRTPYGSVFKGLKLESLWTGVLGGLPGIQTVGVATTNGSLCLLLTSREPIPLLLETTETILSNICDNLSPSSP
ncbi:MAG: hypothetical protein TREMPRED_005029 [Tremellales sp. Tagirdzhanova-0007]|nr:MAG: hypothetical protein TREMPRED_005029 [Tremellales sp. Tagirdzhanova-0007]